MRIVKRLPTYTCWWEHEDSDRVLYHCEAESAQRAAELYQEAVGQSGIVHVRDAAGYITQHPLCPRPGDS
jgi:hypothetical protein